MSDFDDRKKAFENKFQHDETLRFKVASRMGKLLGLWAAGEMGITGAEAEAYAREVVAADLDKPGHEDLLDKIEKDFQARNVSVTRHRLQREMESSLATAREQIMNADKPA
ncbi:MAG: DUF1476 domain-containing protein [Bdellovibrionales bacterium]